MNCGSSRDYKPLLAKKGACVGESGGFPPLPPVVLTEIEGASAAGRGFQLPPPRPPLRPECGGFPRSQPPSPEFRYLIPFGGKVWVVFLIKKTTFFVDISKRHFDGEVSEGTFGGHGVSVLLVSLGPEQALDLGKSSE